MSKTRRCIQAIIMLSALGLALCPSVAYPDTASDLASSEGTLEAKRGELEVSQAEVSRLQAEIDARSAKIAQKQAEYRNVAMNLSLAVRNNYKSMCSTLSPSIDAVMSAQSVDELVSRLQYAEAVTSRLSDMTNDAKSLSADLEREYAEISSKKDQQAQMVDALNGEIAQIESDVESLKVQLSQERAATSRPSSSGSGRSAASTFATESTDGWRTGVASAYGGWSDPSTGAVCGTATGAVCDDWSMGVAVPMAWPDYRSYFNRSVEISYNGQSVIATVNDCGYMGAGSRALDLQPGVFKAFGFSTCDEWGLRTVSYRFL